MSTWPDRFGTRARWPALAMAWGAAVGIVAWWLVETPVESLREQLRHWQFWVLEAQFVLVAGLSSVALPRLVRRLGLSRRELAAPLAASVLALALAAGAAPRTSRIYYDEQIYQSIGQNLADRRLAQMCSDGDVEYGSLHCRVVEYNKEPYGYPYLLSLVYRLAGVHERAAHVVNTLAAAALVWIVFLLGVRLTGRSRVGAYAALVVALIPEQLRWAHTAAAEPTAALACAFAVLAAVEFVAVRSTVALFWAACAGAFAVQFRPECVLLVPFVGAIVLGWAPDELRRQRLWAAALVGFGLTAVSLGHLAAVGHEAWGATGARFSLDFLRPNVRTNGWFYVADARFPAFYTVLVLAAFTRPPQGRLLAVAVGWFLLFWGIFLFFYAGSYNYGADVRFSLMSYAPLALLAGLGADRLAGALAHFAPGRLATRLVAVALCAQFLWYLPYVRSVGEEAWAARADVAFAREAARTLPKNSLVLTHNPSMFHLWGINAAQMSLAPVEPGRLQELDRRYAGGVYLHWNFWCNVDDPVQRALCPAVLDRFPHDQVRQYRERDYTYAFFRLGSRAPAARGWP